MFARVVLTGKYHTQFRDYDPLHCKWLSRDPIAEAGGVNLTGYCGNNPLGGVDELGLRGPEGAWDVVGTPGLWIIGFGQGLWGQVTGIGHLLRQNPIDTIKGVGSAIWNYGDTYGAIKQMVNEELDAAEASYAEMVMLEGRITAEVATLFIGVGELSALAKGGKVAAALSKANLVVKAKVAAALGRAAPVVKVAENVLEKAAKARKFIAREKGAPKRAIKAKNWQAYEKGVRDLYGDVDFSTRQYLAIVSGRPVRGVADAVANIGSRNVAVEAKFVKNWVRSISNPRSPMARGLFTGSRQIAKAERFRIVQQAQKYSAAFKDVIYHSNNPEWIAHYSRLFRKLGITKPTFIYSP